MHSCNLPEATMISIETLALEDEFAFNLLFGSPAWRSVYAWYSLCTKTTRKLEYWSDTLGIPWHDGVLAGFKYQPMPKEGATILRMAGKCRRTEAEPRCMKVNSSIHGIKCPILAMRFASPLCVIHIKLHLDYNYLQISQISTKHHLLPAVVIRLPEEDFHTIGRYPSPPCHHATMLRARLFCASQPSACRVSCVQPNLRYSKHHIAGKCVKE